MKRIRKYKFINYQNEVIHTESTNNPEQVEAKLKTQGYKVGGFSFVKSLLNPSPEQTAAERALRETLASSGISIDL